MAQRNVSLSNLWMNEDLQAQFVAVPISASTITPSKMSPLKMDAQILPKGLHLTSSPVILNSPQRLTSGVIDHSQQHHLVSSEPQGAASWPMAIKRPRIPDFDPDYADTSKRKKGGEKSGKGLRHFSMKVCEKVQRKGTTSYNEVADELVSEFSAPHHRDADSPDQAFDQKNIRRRVYDALNVLMAMNIISKEKKEIKWLGLPTNSAQECQKLEIEKKKILDRMRLKTQQLQDLIIQQVAFKNLVERNKNLEKQNQGPPPNSAIQLPFIIVSTNKKTVIDCSISSDKSEFLFTFDRTFEIHDDIEVLKRMGLALGLDRNACSPGDLERAKRIVPKALEPYVLQMAQGGGDLPPGLTLSTGLKSYDAVPSHHRMNSASTSGVDSDAEVAIVMNNAATQQRLSRQSSVGSSSDLHGRPCTSSPSEDFSGSDSDASSDDEIN